MTKRRLVPAGRRASAGSARRLSRGRPLPDVCRSPDQLRQLRKLIAREKTRRRSRRPAARAFVSSGTARRALWLVAAHDPAFRIALASALARELGQDVYRIDLSGVVRQDIGETEKNLSQVFDKAVSAGAVLFFDEADALFGRRSDVDDAHDRYANVEIGYFLGRADACRTLVMLGAASADGWIEHVMPRITIVWSDT